ncbi:MAG: FAD/FMN-containing dehydrogenase [Candidatus Azotimanducaceae bacterium]|jgi:FAD/FMN-containing dehydrogenase
MLEQQAIEQLARLLTGRLVTPQEPDYDDVRSVWNGMIDRRPSAIAQCSGTEDVIAAINFARQQRVPISVRGGGHSVAGTSVCEQGLMIDLSLVREVRIDAVAKVAHVGPGTLLGDLDAEAQAFGLAVPAGVDSRTGVAGLTLGGGQGFLSRSFGLTVDSLKSMDVVTADGQQLHVSEQSHPDLFWALRGGGGNFAVVTSFEFRLHKVGPQVMAAQVFYPSDDGASVLRAYRDFMDAAADEVSIYALCVPVPSVEPFPESHHGKTAIALVGCYSGDLEMGRDLLAPLAEFGQPLVASIEAMEYKVLQSSFTEGAPNGGRYYWKSNYFAELSDAAIDVMAERALQLPGPYSNFFIEPLGGAISRIAPKATAFPHRNAKYSFGISSGWVDAADDATAISWTRDFHKALAQFGTGQFYVNYLDQDELDNIETAFGDNFARLQRVKEQYDPEGLFQLGS